MPRLQQLNKDLKTIIKMLILAILIFENLIDHNLFYLSQ